MYKLILTDHAFARYNQRVGTKGRKKIENEIAQRLFPALCLGLKTVAGGAVEVGIPGNMVAVCVPSVTGGWAVLTIKYGEAG